MKKYSYYQFYDLCQFLSMIMYLCKINSNEQVYFVSDSSEYMKQFIFSIFIGIISFPCSAQLPVSIDSVYQFIKVRSIHSKNADWNKIDTVFYTHLKNAKTEMDSVKCFLKVFESLNDVHSQIYYKGQSYANFPDFDDSTLKYLLPIVQKSQEQTGIIKSKLLDNKYVYLQVPSIQASGEMINSYAKSISDTLSKYNARKIKGFILDLRLNGGGQLTSMLTGLFPLLGESNVAVGVDSDGIETRRMQLKDGNFYINDVAMTSIQKPKVNFQNKAVVVLIGPNTRSSGSITAIAFKGRSNTFFIGENTASGYTTGNDYFFANGNFLLNLSTEFNQDRQKIIYKDSVPPDHFLRGEDDFDNLMKDSKILLAIEQLKKMKNTK